MKCVEHVGQLVQIDSGRHEATYALPVRAQFNNETHTFDARTYVRRANGLTYVKVMLAAILMDRDASSFAEYCFAPRGQSLRVMDATATQPNPELKQRYIRTIAEIVEERISREIGVPKELFSQARSNSRFIS